MQRYKDFQPTGFDPKGLALEDKQEWFVVPVSRTRDSGPLAEANFEAALEMLGGETDNVEVHRFGHWGPGWFEIIIVNPESPIARTAEEIEESLENYPVLDDDKFSEMEEELKDQSWDSWGDSELLEIYKELSFPDIECEIEIDSQKARTICFYAMEIDCSGDSCVLRTADVKERLQELSPSEFWELLEIVTISKEDFNSLDHIIYHHLFKSGTKIKDYETNELLQVPDFIAVQYVENQLKLFS